MTKTKNMSKETANKRHRKPIKKYKCQQEKTRVYTFAKV